MSILLVGSFVIALSMMAAQLLLATKRSWAWLCVAFVQLEYITFGALTGQWGFVLGACVFIVINIRNYLKWRREERRDEARSGVVAHRRRGGCRGRVDLLRVPRRTR